MKTKMPIRPKLKPAGEDKKKVCVMVDRLRYRILENSEGQRLAKIEKRLEINQKRTQKESCIFFAGAAEITPLPL